MRYLGDLSGGQIIARRLRDHYGIDGEGAAFYDFSALGKIKPYRDAYRERLDALELHDDVRDRVLAEAVLAFRLNTALFRALDERHRAAVEEPGADEAARPDGAAGAGKPYCPHVG